ncbi:MAG: fatty acid desaturase [Myxococcota bacterium]|jgi:fatty acid desaturase
MKRSTSTRQHLSINARMLAETVLLLTLFAGICLAGHHTQQPIVLLVGAVLQGLWLQRLYCVGHEAAHNKLFPEHPFANDIVGQIALWTLPVPLPIFKAIHRFHHAANRRDAQTSALDVYLVSARRPWLGRLQASLLWYVGVLAGGWFFHALISVLLFLFMPIGVARRISPAFSRWRVRDQISSILLFAAPVLVQVLVATQASSGLWLALFGWPLLVFALVYSAQLYVYHYRTTMGPQTLLHARRLHGGPLLGWWLLNLNEHDTHHQKTKVVWYDLPAASQPLPDAFAANQNVDHFLAGLLQQLRGPTLVEKP